ncbi:MAG: type II CAAX prenyl endopeptidase Rce1 family protein, partial [Candidatus Hermodarchaeota archaeon]
WAFSSIDRFFIQFINLPDPERTNIILSSIPYPFNPSYLILNFFVSDRTPLNLWISSIIGLVILVLITLWLYTRALKQLEKLTFSKFHDVKDKRVSNRTKKELEIKIKSISPVKAYLRKDVILISHDLKTFLTIITSVILSFIFLFYYNTGIIGQDVHIINVVYTNWIGLLIFHPIISVMLIHSILSLEDSGQSVLTSLPIIPREQAKTKLYIIFTIQTIAAFLPNLMFLNDSNLNSLLLATFAGLPFIWLFLMIVFELKISYFGKIGKRYVIKEVNPDNKLFKWVLIISVQYILSFWMISFVLMAFLYNNLTAIAWFTILTGTIGLVIVRIIYTAMFPSRSKLRRMAYIKEKKVSKEVEFKPTVIQHPTILKWHPWVSIFLLLFLDFCFLQLDMSIIREESPYFDPSIILYLMDILHVIIYNLAFASFLFILVPFALGLPYGRQSIRDYSNSIGLDWIKFALKGLPIISIIVPFILILHVLLPSTVSILNFNTDIIYYSNLTIISFFSYIFWQEILFRGVILRILLNKYSKQTAIFLNSIIFWLWFSFLHNQSIMISVLFLFLGFFLSFLSVKTNSLLPAIIISTLISSMYFPFLL